MIYEGDNSKVSIIYNDNKDYTLVQVLSIDNMSCKKTGSWQISPGKHDIVISYSKISDDSKYWYKSDGSYPLVLMWKQVTLILLDLKS